jgi:hypothetical protein
MVWFCTDRTAIAQHDALIVRRTSQRDEGLLHRDHQTQQRRLEIVRHGRRHSSPHVTSADERRGGLRHTEDTPSERLETLGERAHRGGVVRHGEIS